MVDQKGVGRHIMEDEKGVSFRPDKAFQLLPDRQLTRQTELDPANTLIVTHQTETEDDGKQGAQHAVEGPFQPVLVA